MRKIAVGGAKCGDPWATWLGKTLNILKCEPTEALLEDRVTLSNTFLRLHMLD
jgi:hypothetical protein